MIQWKINGICISSTLACSLLYIATTGCTDGYVTSGYHVCGYAKESIVVDNYVANSYVTGGYVGNETSTINYVTIGYVTGGYV